MAKSKWHEESERDELKVLVLSPEIREELLKTFPKPDDNREYFCEVHGTPKWHRAFYDGGFKGIIAHYWRCDDCFHEEDVRFKKMISDIKKYGRYNNS